jgi:hypothetical protein
MPQLGRGIVPGGSIGTELTYVTRRAFIPQLVVQIYKATPMLSLLLRNAQRAAGGVSQVTVPVQGSSFVQWAWTDYSGTFQQPPVLPGVTNAEFNLDVGVVPIPFLGMEGLMQSTEAVVPLLKARMADAKTVAVQQLSTSIFANNSATTNVLNGLPEAYDAGANVATYGGISRTANSFWQASYFGSAGAVLTRAAFFPYILRTTLAAGGERPDFIVMSFSDWTALAVEFMGVEQYNTYPGQQYGDDTIPNAGFSGLMLGGVPIFADPFLAKGTAYMINSKYLAMYVSEDADFAFSGFYSTVPNLQIGSIGLMVVALNMVCTKPSSGSQITGISGGSF